MGKVEAKNFLVFRMHRSYASKHQNLEGHSDLVIKDTE